MKTIFIDSNVFLQCRDIKELPWETLLNGDTELKLLVPRGVQKEIDNFKGQGNNRRSKRARLASTYFRDILNSPSDSIAIRENVTLSFPKRKELSQVPSVEGLDLSRNDDSIIQDILAFRVLYPDEVATLISDDTNLIGTAKEHEVPFIFTPVDWQLQPEADENTKTINTLKEEINKLKKNYPEINLEVTPEELKLNIYKFPSLTDNQIDEIVESIIRDSEHSQSFLDKYLVPNVYSLAMYKAPSEQEIQEYSTQTLPAWKEQAKLALKSIHKNIYVKKNCFNFTFAISNIGNVPAENLIVVLEGSESLLIYSGLEHNILAKDISLPKIPEPPTPKLFNDYGSLFKSLKFKIDTPLITNHFKNNITKDRNSFYWQQRRDNLTRNQQEASCEEFRHKVAPEAFSFWLLVAYDSNPTGGSLTCTVSAKNLPDHEKLVLPVKVEYHQGNTLEAFNEHTTLPLGS